MKPVIRTSVLISGSRITVAVAEKTAADYFKLLAKVSCMHDGIFKGEFLNVENFNHVLLDAILKAEKESKVKIKNINISVPVEFCEFKKINVIMQHSGKRKITNEILNELQTECCKKNPLQGKSILSCNSLNYTLDDEYNTFNPAGKKSSKLACEYSVIYIENFFVEVINKALSGLYLLAISYVPIPLAQYHCMFKNMFPSQGVIFIDSDYLCTNINYARGNGCERSFTFALGFAHIISDIQEAFLISYEKAEEIAADAVLTVQPKASEIIKIGSKTIPKYLINELVTWRIGQIGKQIKKCLEIFKEQGINISTIFLFGDGIAKIKGIKQALFRTVETNIEIITPPNPGFPKTEESGIYSLLSFSL